MQGKLREREEGPFYAVYLRPGDPYELSHGEPIKCAPRSARGGGPTGMGFSVLASDPSVKEAGIDVGYSPDPKTLRAPDVAIGNVPDKPGWVQGVPDLALE